MKTAAKFLFIATFPLWVVPLAIFYLFVFCVFARDEWP